MPTLEDLYKAEDFPWVGKVKWGLIKKLKLKQFQDLYNPNARYMKIKHKSIGNIVYSSILLQIHEDKLCVDCNWCALKV